ncbi:dehydrogenase/reductase SDR family member 11-like [Crassostrea angulata]|uniref:Dehydrogenase/reductase SDR family member 11 n=1 Tax=Magallana gigas TaxID=29159 RepID=A0A8W8L4P2_MAGGI|nr:dehydrogenase/reductase SDR family member 11 [Crassostrea gigas]XP_052686663.1 dehydrogenase/reductase SDR family member 11-like [Crassostrea angulata]|eukprot:XP_011432073.1 PREDICTED: dehydrogenase/reductase SDR family member 11 [Crassostrea gigas]
MEKWEGRAALVTGASMGSGRAIAKMLASHGMRVAACARSIEKLQTLTTECMSLRGSILPIKCDLTVREDIEAMFSLIREKLLGVDVCVNNAGLALDAPIIDGHYDDWEVMWQVNVRAVCMCTHLSVKSMLDRGVDDGHIININSLSGHRLGKAHFYSATKYAVTALTEGVRWELRRANSHIKITSISPGLVRTNFAYNLMGREDGEECYNTRQALLPDDMAKSVEFVLATPPHVQVSEMMIRPTEQVV